MKYLLLAPLLFLSVFSFGQISNDAPPPPPQPSVYHFVETMPEFPGGQDAMTRFLQKNIQYPDSARNHNIAGRVIVSFVVMEDGSLTDVKVVKNVAWDLDAEAIRVVKLMPKFIPGKQQGKAVKVQFNLPISFRLS
jgi:protein TonB